MKKILKAKNSDFEKFYHLFGKLLANESYRYPTDTFPYIISEEFISRNTLKSEIAKGTRPLYIAYSNDELVGYLLTMKPFAGVGFGDWFGVINSHRNQGIGTRLLTKWEEDIAKQGAHSLYLWTTDNNISYYKKRGFILGGNFPKSWFGMDHFLFYKNLHMSSRNSLT